MLISSVKGGKMFFSSGEHKEEHLAWSGLVDGVYAIAATLVVYNSSLFWNHAVELVREKAITQNQATMIIIDHFTCMIISAIICFDLWGLCSIAYRTPGKGNRLTTLLMTLTMISGVGITTAFQVIFNWRLEITEKSQIITHTRGPEIGLILVIVLGYLSVKVLLTHIKAVSKKYESDNSKDKQLNKLNAAIKHCTRSMIILSVGGFLFVEFKENVWGVGILGVSIITNWLYPEISRRIRRSKI
jgi:hypothetical protein